MEKFEVTTGVEIASEAKSAEKYQETDVFAWANNLVQYKDELKIPKLDAKESVFFWFKFDKTNDDKGLNSLYSFIKISHD